MYDQTGLVLDYQPEALLIHETGVLNIPFMICAWLATRRSTTSIGLKTTLHQQIFDPSHLTLFGGRCFAFVERD